MNGLPRLRGLPGLGSLIPFARDPLQFLSDARAAHGPRVHFRLVQHNVLFLDDPHDVELCLVKQAARLHKDALYEMLRPAMGNGLVTSEDDQWRRNRKLAAPSFTARHITSYGEAMVRCTRAATDRLANESSIELQHEMLLLTRDIALATLFGDDLDVDASPVAEALEVAMAHFISEVQGIHRVLPYWLPTPSRRRMRRAIGALDDTVYRLIAARKAAGLGDDLLSRLIAAREDDGSGFTETELRDEVATAFLAGHETTALALTYTHHLLRQHPEVRQRMLAEITDVVGDRDPTSDDVSALPYTQAVIQESMRVIPPVCWVGREVKEPIALPDLEVPVGWQLLFATWTMHRNAEWFEDPLAFKPERWLDADWAAQLPRLAYYPFGAGPRVCIGKHFAMLEAVLVLVALMQRVWLEPVEPLPRLLPSVTLRPSAPMPARVNHR